MLGCTFYFFMCVDGALHAQCKTQCKTQCKEQFSGSILFVGIALFCL